MARALVLMIGNSFADLPEDWKVLCKMSKAVNDKLFEMGLQECDAAMKHRNATRTVLGRPSYSLALVVHLIHWLRLAAVSRWRLFV